MGEAAVKARGLRLVQRRHRRVPLPGRRLLLPRDEHAAAGRAPRDRAGHRARPRGQCGRVGRAAVVHPGRRSSGAATPSRSASTPRTPPAAASCPSPGPITKLRVAAGLRRALGRRLRGGRRGQPVLRQPHRQADRLGQGSRRPPSPACCGRSSEMRGRRRRHDDPGRHRDPRDTRTSPPPSTRRSGSRTRSTCPVSRRRPRPPPAPTDDAEPKVRRDVDVEVNGKRFSVKRVGARDAPPPRRPAARRRGRGPTAAGRRRGGGRCRRQRHGHRAHAGHDREGARRGRRPVEAGQPVCVLEAMKMENNIAAEKAGTVKEIRVSRGDTVGSGDIVVVISERALRRTRRRDTRS